MLARTSTCTTQPYDRCSRGTSRIARFGVLACPLPFSPHHRTKLNRWKKKKKKTPSPRERELRLQRNWLHYASGEGGAKEEMRRGEAFTDGGHAHQICKSFVVPLPRDIVLSSEK